MIERPLQPLATAKADKAREFRRAIIADDAAMTASRRLAKLITGGARFDDPVVVDIADRLREHLERIITPTRGHA